MDKAIGDDIRPRGTVERRCDVCGWDSWHDPLSPAATAIPFVCESCQLNAPCTFECESCYREVAAGWRDWHTARDPRCADCKALPPGVAPAVIHCRALVAANPTIVFCDRPVPCDLPGHALCAECGGRVGCRACGGTGRKAA